MQKPYQPTLIKSADIAGKARSVPDIPEKVEAEIATKARSAPDILEIAPKLEVLLIYLR